MTDFADRNDQDLLIDEQINAFYTAYEAHADNGGFLSLIDTYTAGRDAISEQTVREGHDIATMHQSYDNCVLPYLNANNPAVQDEIQSYKQELEAEIEALYAEQESLSAEAEQIMRDHYSDYFNMASSVEQRDIPKPEDFDQLLDDNPEMVNDLRSIVEEFSVSIDNGAFDSRSYFHELSIDEVAERAAIFTRITGEPLNLSAGAQDLMDETLLDETAMYDIGGVVSSEEGRVRNVFEGSTKDKYPENITPENLFDDDGIKKETDPLTGETVIINRAEPSIPVP